MASATDYANWIVNNEDKKGTPEFNTVVQAYQEAKQLEAGATVTTPEVSVKPKESIYSQAIQGGADVLKGVPRAGGIVTRAGLQGAGSLLDLLAMPVRGAMNLALPKDMQIKPISIGEEAANVLNLPKPATMPERVASGVSEAVSGANTPYAATKLIKPAQEVAGAIPKSQFGEKVGEIGTAIRTGLGRDRKSTRLNSSH